MHYPVEFVSPTRRSMNIYAAWLLMFVSGFVMFEPSPFELLGICLIGLGIVSGMSIPKGLGLLASCYFLYIIFSLPASLIAVDIDLALKPVFIRVFLGLIMLYLACLVFEDPKRNLAILLNGYMLGAVIITAISIPAYFGLIPMSDLFLAFDGTRLKSTFKDPNVYGPYLVPVLVYLFSRIENGQSRLIINGLFMCLITVGLLLCFSRGSWMNAFLTMGFYVGLRFMTMKNYHDVHRMVNIGALGLVVTILLIGYLLTTDVIGDLFQQRAQVQGYDVTERFFTQSKAIATIFTQPLGIGVGQVEPNFGIVPHNVFLFILSEGGWFSGTMFIFFFALTVYRGFKFCLLRTEMQIMGFVLLSSIVSTLIQSFFIDSTHWRHLYVLIGLLWGLILHYEGRLRE